MYYGNNLSGISMSGNAIISSAPRGPDGRPEEKDDRGDYIILMAIAYCV